MRTLAPKGDPPASGRRRDPPEACRGYPPVTGKFAGRRVWDTPSRRPCMTSGLPVWGSACDIVLVEFGPAGPADQSVRELGLRAQDAEFSAFWIREHHPAVAGAVLATEVSHSRGAIGQQHVQFLVSGALARAQVQV